MCKKFTNTQKLGIFNKSRDYSTSKVLKQAGVVQDIRSQLTFYPYHTDSTYSICAYVLITFLKI